MAAKVHWGRLVGLGLIFGGLFLTRNLWQPPLFAFLFPRQQKLEGIKLVLDVINGLGALAPLLYGAYKFIFAQPAAQKSADGDRLLTLTSPEEIIREWVTPNPEGITWLDREIVTCSDLRQHQYIVLVGRMKSGKTHEAAELIRRALDEGLLNKAQVYDIAKGVRELTPEVIQAGLSRELNRGTSALFFINDLPKQAQGRQIESLSKFLRTLEGCSPGYFLATARSEQLAANTELDKWLGQNKVKRIEMKPLSERQKSMLIGELGRKYDLEISAEAEWVLIEKSDGSPYHLILTFTYLAQEGEKTITREVADQIISKSIKEIWTDIRNVLKKDAPASASLLEALAVCYDANVPADSTLVLAYATALERKKRKTLLPWLAAQRLDQAVKIVQHYGIEHKDRFVIPDAAIEGLIAEGVGRDRLAVFLRGYRKLFRNRLLRKLNPQAKPLQEAWHALGVSYYFAGESEKALECLEMAQRVRQPTETLWAALGGLLDELGRQDEAEQTFRQAIAADPKGAAAWSNLGVLLDKLGRKDEAEQAYRQAIATNPQLAQAWSNLGGLLGELGRQDEAEQAFRQAIAADPKHAAAWSNLGVLLGELGRKEEAEQAYRQAVAADPKHAAAWYNLGILLAELGRKEEAEQAYRQATAADPKHAAAWSNLGVLLEELGRQDKAEQAFRQAIAADPKYAKAWSNLGILLAELGCKDEAEQAFRQAIAADPKYAIAWYNLGVLLEELGRQDEAEQAFRKSLEVSQGAEDR